MNRLDELVACTQDDRALRLYATLHLTASLVLLLLSWRDWRRFGLRLTQLVVLAIFASVASVRKSVLCADSDPAFFLIFYAWSSIAFAACYRIESTLGDEDDDILDKEVKIV